MASSVIVAVIDMPIVIAILLLVVGGWDAGGAQEAKAGRAGANARVLRSCSTYPVKLAASGLTVYRDPCLRTGGLDVMAPAEVCIANALVRRYGRREIYGFGEAVPRDLLGHVVGKRGLFVDTVDSEIVFVFSGTTRRARELERTIESQERAQDMKEGITGGVPVADRVRSRGIVTYWGFAGRLGGIDAFPRCFR